jgi:serine/threonine protein kinase
MPDSIQHDSQLRAFVNEIKVLGCLQWSPYVVKLIGIAWEHDTHTQLSPVLALEYAQHNSLSRFLADDSGNSITFREKKKLISNVTGGVNHLHEANFVWGDCNPKNVLICQDPNDPTTFTAKISDFGLSVYCSSKSVRFCGFSIPWTSREARDAVGSSALKQSEMYSLGLVIWSILMHGQQFRKERWGSDRSLVLTLMERSIINRFFSMA